MLHKIITCGLVITLLLCGCTLSSDSSTQSMESTSSQFVDNEEYSEYEVEMESAPKSDPTDESTSELEDDILPRPSEEQMEEIERAQAILDTFDWPAKADGEWGYSVTHHDDLKLLAEELAEQGIAVSFYNRVSYNMEKVREFSEAVAAGRSAYVTVIFALDDWDVKPWAYYTDGKQAYACGSWDSALPWRLDENLTSVSEFGYFYGFYGYNILRIEPLPQDYYDAYWEYVYPLNYFVLTDNWDVRDRFSSYTLSDIFEAVDSYEKTEYFSSEFPYSTEVGGNSYDVPAQVVEESILRYYATSVENLRKASNYDAGQNIYHLRAGGRGGMYPITEVWGVQENADGTLAIQVAFVDVTSVNGEINSILTVKPMEDGSFRYLSNDTMHK